MAPSRVFTLLASASYAVTLGEEADMTLCLKSFIGDTTSTI